MVKNGFLSKAATITLALALLIALVPSGQMAAQDGGPVILDPALGVRPAVGGLTTPIGVAFLNETDMFVIEKNTGQVLHVSGGAVSGTALDLAVNFASERGLLSIALDPGFASNGFVYLYWTCSAPAPAGLSFFPGEVECADEPMTGADTDETLAVPLLANRVDRFVWDGASLTWDMNLIKLRAYQNDGAPIPRGQGDQDQPERGNHNGGVITFGQDGMLYVIIGDEGRRGAMQNLPFGPIPYGAVEDGPNPQTMTDDQFGGPAPDDAHFTGVILRMNPDGTPPSDNPFFEVGAGLGGEIGENIALTFAYGIRNSFGMTVDPDTGNLWISENGEDAYDELNLVEPGFNSGWIQFMGPAEDIADYKEIETTSTHFEDFPNLQQFRWAPEFIADTPDDAASRLFELPGSSYSDPEFSWEFAIAPAAIGFVEGDALGTEYTGDLFVGLSVPLPLGGALLKFEMAEGRDALGVEELEAENVTFNSLIGSEENLIGANFGVVTDIATGPNGSLYVVSLSNGAVYEIFRESTAESIHLVADLTGANEVPGPGDEDGLGESHVLINALSSSLCFSIVAQQITLPAAAAHIHVGEEGVAGDVVVPLAPPDELGNSASCVTGVDTALIDAILQNPSGYYVNVHTSDFPDGAIRGQLDFE